MDEQLGFFDPYQMRMMADRQNFTMYSTTIINDTVYPMVLYPFQKRAIVHGPTGLTEIPFEVSESLAEEMYKNSVGLKPFGSGEVIY